MPPKDLVLTELFLGQRGAGEVVCTAPTQLKVYEYGKSLCKNKTTQWFLYYFAFYKYKQLCLTIIIRSFTSKHSVQAPRRACKWARHEILRRQADCGRASEWHRYVCRGFAPAPRFASANIDCLTIICAFWLIAFLNVGLSVAWKRSTNAFIFIWLSSYLLR